MYYHNQFMINNNNNIITLENFLKTKKNQLKLNKELSVDKINLLKAMNTLYRLHAGLDTNSQEVSKNTKTGFCKSKYINKKSKNIMCNGVFQKSAKKSIILTNELIQKVSKMDDNDVSIKLNILNVNIEKIEKIEKINTINFTENPIGNEGGIVIGGDKKKKLGNKNKAELQKLKNK